MNDSERQNIARIWDELSTHERFLFLMAAWPILAKYIPLPSVNLARLSTDEQFTIANLRAMVDIDSPIHNRPSFSMD